MATMTSVSKTTSVSAWGIFDNGTGGLVYIGMSRSQARDYRNEFDDNSHLTGPRKINVNAKLA